MIVDRLLNYTPDGK